MKLKTAGFDFAASSGWGNGSNYSSFSHLSSPQQNFVYFHVEFDWITTNTLRGYSLKQHWIGAMGKVTLCFSLFWSGAFNYHNNPPFDLWTWLQTFWPMPSNNHSHLSIWQQLPLCILWCCITFSGSISSTFLHSTLPSSYHLESLIVHYWFSWVFCPSFLFEFDFPWILVLWDNVPWAKLLEVLLMGVWINHHSLA